MAPSYWWFTHKSFALEFLKRGPDLFVLLNIQWKINNDVSSGGNTAVIAENVTVSAPAGINKTKSGCELWKKLKRNRKGGTLENIHLLSNSNIQLLEHRYIHRDDEELTDHIKSFEIYLDFKI